jgi:quercetin dioxygenase-like cupin family protein
MTNSIQQKWMVACPGEQFCIPVPAAATNSLYSVVEIVSVPGDGTPLHLHNKEDEYMVVLEGTVRVALGEKVFDLLVGESAMLPRGIPHAWGNRTSSNIRMVFVCTTGGCEEGLRIVAEEGVTDLAAIGERFKIDVLGPVPF